VLQPLVLSEVLPVMKELLRSRSESPGLESLRCCAVFRTLIKIRPNDFLTDDLENKAAWMESLTATFCTETTSYDFKRSLEGKEKEWLALLESAEPLEVVKQANCMSLVTQYWEKSYEEYTVFLEPRMVFISRVVSILVLVMSVLLHIKIINGHSPFWSASDTPLWSEITSAGAEAKHLAENVISPRYIGWATDASLWLVWAWAWAWNNDAWLYVTLATGAGFILQEVYQAIRLGASYLADSWNCIDFAGSSSIIAFAVIHFRGYSTTTEMSAGIVIALLSALRLLQTASLHQAVGPLILAVVKMISDISMFLVLYAYILLIFAGVFNVLSSDEDHEYFGTYGKATLTLFYAAVGEFNDTLNNAIESHDTLGAVLLFIYVVLSSIILLNLLIAIMASTYAAIENTKKPQYQLRIRVLNEYLSMPQHERLPPPFNLIAAIKSVPLRCLAPLLPFLIRLCERLLKCCCAQEWRPAAPQSCDGSGFCQCCKGFWWFLGTLFVSCCWLAAIVALVVARLLASTIDAVLFTIAFMPATILYLVLVNIPNTAQGIRGDIRWRRWGDIVCTFVCLPVGIVILPFMCALCIIIFFLTFYVEDVMSCGK